MTRNCPDEGFRGFKPRSLDHCSDWKLEKGSKLAHLGIFDPNCWIELVYQLSGPSLIAKMFFLEYGKTPSTTADLQNLRVITS